MEQGCLQSLTWVLRAVPGACVGGSWRLMTMSFFRQDVYGLYDPRYRPSDGAAYVDPCRCPEPERPGSRASHCSDRPVAR